MPLTPDTMLTAGLGSMVKACGRLATSILSHCGLSRLCQSSLGARWLEHRLRTITCQCSKPRETYQWWFSL